ncbi:hypothetical protein F4778DRAFT_325769 [Xylariomycetidae sp. FL2044]|nr:hypothetical protein F4778DRAFT_325769 [Xylariomycetidae sp. FL2044]
MAGRERLSLSLSLSLSFALLREESRITRWRRPSPAKTRTTTYVLAERDAVRLCDLSRVRRGGGRRGKIRERFRTKGKGKLKVPARPVRRVDRHRQDAGRMFAEVYEEYTFEGTRVVLEAAHYIAEENPEGFVRECLRFIDNVLSNK